MAQYFADRDGADAPQPPKFEPAEAACPRVGEDDLIGSAGERLVCQALACAPDPGDEHAEVDGGVTVHQLGRSGQMLSRQFAAHPVPQDGARVAATPRRALLGREREDRDVPALLARGQTQATKGVVRTRAGPIKNQGVGRTAFGRHVAERRLPALSKFDTSSDLEVNSPCGETEE
jgi:hypothetical protein